MNYYILISKLKIVRTIDINLFIYKLLYSHKVNQIGQYMQVLQGTLEGGYHELIRYYVYYNEFFLKRDNISWTPRCMELREMIFFVCKISHVCLIRLL